MIWTDPTGEEWEVVDWRYDRGKRKRHKLGDGYANGRAFVSTADASRVLIYEFARPWDYHGTDDKVLRMQFSLSVAPGSTMLEQMRKRGMEV